jgi:hypothetical protein
MNAQRVLKAAPRRWAREPYRSKKNPEDKERKASYGDQRFLLSISF